MSTLFFFCYNYIVPLNYGTTLVYLEREGTKHDLFRQYEKHKKLRKQNFKSLVHCTEFKIPAQIKSR